MNRAAVIESLLPELGETLVICNIGLPSQELHMLGDRAQNFYMLGTMGLASSIGLGLALSQPAPVLAIDGDGSVLTNLATLATMANNPAGNFTLFVVDNGSYGSTGDQPTYAGGKTSLAAVASACGCAEVIECAAPNAAATLRAALAADAMTVIVCKCAPGNIAVPTIPMNPVTIRDRFMAAVQRADSR